MGREETSVSETPNDPMDEKKTAREIANLSPEDQVRYAVRQECYTPDRINDVTQVTTAWTKDVIEEMEAAGALERETVDGEVRFRLPESERPDPTARAEPKPSMTDRDGDDTVTGPEATDSDVAESRKTHGGMLPVDRDYDWERHKLDPDSVADFVDADGTLDDILAEIDARDVTGKEPRFKIPGPTGCGKTTLAEVVAVELDAPCFFIECHDGLRPSNLLGMPTYVGDETWWTDGPIPKVLQASKAANDPTTDFDEVVVIFDEVNRTTARTLGVVMSALDHRCEVTLNARGGETVSGDAMNLVSFATMNEGDGYIVNPMDRAQKRRFGNTFPVDYIGVHDVDAEADLLTEVTPIGDAVARQMVVAANEIRAKADDEDVVQMGVPTSEMISWAQTAYTHRDRAGSEGPVKKAAEITLLDNFYSDDQQEREVVETILETEIGGMEVRSGPRSEDEDDDDAESLGDLFGDPDADDDAYGDGSDDAHDTSIDVSDDTWLMCRDGCGEYIKADEADPEVKATMNCPNCGENLDPVAEK